MLDSFHEAQKVSHNIRANEKFKAISAGVFHSIALTSQNRLMIWGTSKDSQLGIPGQRMSAVPKELNINGLKSDEFVEHVGCGIYHSVAATSAA
jgi:alpha-tubulin suppressor-like RCC1 family protein